MAARINVGAYRFLILLGLEKVATGGKNQVDCEKLQIWNTSFTLLDISLDGYMRELIPMGYRCYNEQHVVTRWSEPTIMLSRFHISNKLNLLTAVGCDTRADIKTIGSEGYILGSLSMTDCTQTTSGSCLGMGCNQVPVPYRMTSFRIHAQSNTGNVGKSGYNNCTYAFLVEKGNYTFKETDLYNMRNRYFPTLFEWWVGRMSCDEAQKNNSDFAFAILFFLSAILALFLCKVNGVTNL